MGSRLLQTVVTDREGLAAEIQDIVSLSLFPADQVRVADCALAG